MSVIVKAKIKEHAKVDGQQMNVASDLAEALNIEAVKLIEKAAARAKANNRSTVMAKDL